MVKQLVPGLLVAAVLAALPGCGRIQSTAPAPPQAALTTSNLPSARSAIAWALAAGLGGERFFVAYNADRTGPIVAVGRWEEDGDLTHFTASVAFDAQGHRLAAPADEEEDEAS